MKNFKYYIIYNFRYFIKLIFIIIFILQTLTKKILYIKDKSGNYIKKFKCKKITN